MQKLNQKYINRIVKKALNEDLKPNGDITTNLINKPEVLFAYNANNGLFNALTDYVHRQISPSTYSCNLCKITYDNWDRNQRWSTYIDSVPIQINFTYKPKTFYNNII